MTIHSAHFKEKLTVFVWTSVLMFLPKPFLLREVMAALVGLLTTTVLLLIALALIMPLSRLGEQIVDWTPMQSVRHLLDVLLPVTGVFIVTHPMTPPWVCVTKKFLLLEGQLWKNWCPEAYIIVVSLSCILAIFRKVSRVRSTVEAKLDQDPERNIKMIHFAADQLCEHHISKAAMQ